MRSKKAFSPRATQHVYQRTKDHGVLFYSVEDRLVYYTLAAVNARKHGIKVSAASLMFTHIHQSLVARSFRALWCYLHDVGTSFARMYNHRHNRHGELFEKDPGRSQKYTSKDKRSNLCYVYNNHVEKGLCSKATEERWAFLAYAGTDHPFSEEIIPGKASPALRRWLRLIDKRVSAGRPLTYFDLDRAFSVIDPDEKEQFIDYVIARYAWIDFSEAISHYGDLETMINAFDTASGGEFEIKEDFSKDMDTGYEEMISLMGKGLHGTIFKMSGDELAEALFEASAYTNATADQIRRFFHLSDDSSAAK